MATWGLEPSPTCRAFTRLEIYLNHGVAFVSSSLMTTFDTLLPPPSIYEEDRTSEQQAASSEANRSSLIEEAAKAKITARDDARLERQ